MLKNLFTKLQQPVSVAPLISFRILFGLMVLYGVVFSFWKDDITNRYLEPSFFFKYYGFEWVGFVGETGLYVLYVVWILSAIGIVLGLFYRWAIAAFFFVFTYLQLLDATNYINHYYAISIFAFFLFFVPANGSGSLDVWRKPQDGCTHVPRWCLSLFKFQIGIIYTFASIAKMNPDWMFGAMPLKIWLLQSQDFPLIGGIFHYHSVHMTMSWIGLLFDLTIVWWLLLDKTRPIAYGVVVIFHVLTGLLFNIGLFPVVMIFSTTIFWKATTHERLLQAIGLWKTNSTFKTAKIAKWWWYFCGLHCCLQIILPLRSHFLYTGNPLWTEEGYRFSWRVMLVEKEGMAIFTVTDSSKQRSWEVDNLEFLTPFQEKRMAVRPDHILQYAHYLSTIYGKRYDIKAPIVQAKVHVTLNGRVSQLLIDPTVNLTKKERRLWQKDWILPFGGF